MAAAPSSWGRPPLPVRETCRTFELIEGSWQAELPALLRANPRSYDAIICLVPSAILFGPKENSIFGWRLLRTALRIQRPRAEWDHFATTAHSLLVPGGSLLTADVVARRYVHRLALPPSTWHGGPLNRGVLTRAGFDVEETPASGGGLGELCLRATRVH